MIDPAWKRICGLHVQDNADMATVWLAYDKTTDVVHMYDACVFKAELPVVVAEGLNARGRWIPISWNNDGKEMAESLLDRGCSTLRDGVTDSDAMAEVVSRDIQERQRTGRFKVDKRLGEWLDEYKTFFRQGGKVPRDGYPLMSATRHAMESIAYAKRQSSKKKQRRYTQVAIV